MGINADIINLMIVRRRFAIKDFLVSNLGWYKLLNTTIRDRIERWNCVVVAQMIK